jgi:hypothetical protein
MLFLKRWLSVCEEVSVEIYKPLFVVLRTEVTKVKGKKKICNSVEQSCISAKD